MHVGSMFSGKTSGLIENVRRFQIAGYKVLTFRPAIDNRYSETEVSNHNLAKIPAIIVESMAEICEQYSKHYPQVVAIDEFQFIKGAFIKDQIDTLLKDGCTVILAGLDIDYQGNAFENIKELLPEADYIHKHHAVCIKCGSDAWISHRKTQEEGRVVVGSSNYEPLCRSCYLKAKQEGI